MQYIDQKEILEKTDGGRSIIELYYPDSPESFNQKGRKFKARESEKTASSSVKRLPDGTWLVTDFGGDQKPRNAIQIVQLEENCDFKTAIGIIAQKFNILPEDKKSEILKPTITRRPATAEEPEGNWYFEVKEFTMSELLIILAPKVWEFLVRLAPADVKEGKESDSKESLKMEAAMEEVVRVFKEYSFYSLKSYTIIKNREAIVIESSELYPIFIFDQGDWKKIYQPRSMDASRRFMHYGGRPSDFIFGYKQAHKAYNEIVRVTDDEDEEDDQGKKKKGKPKKLKQLIIATGGSDALNIACIGQCFKGKDPEKLAEQYFPVWMNSETAKLSPGQFKNFQGIAETVYNLPDIDATGKKQAHALALEYLDIQTIYLPEELKEKKDGLRNKACKDVRDYFRFWTPWDFFKLFKTAYPYRFWDVKPRYNKQGEYTGIGYDVNNKHLYNFLHRNGFYRYATDSEKDMYFYIRITNNVVQRIEPKKIRDFVNDFIEKRNPEVELMNVFLRTTQLNENSMSNLPFVEIDFTDFDHDTQWMFLKNRTVKISKEGVEDYRPGDVEKFVWDEEVINHRFQKMDNFFDINLEGDLFDMENLKCDIDIKNSDCLVFRYLINASRIHWRQELENRLDGIPEKDREMYATIHNLRKEEMKLMEGLSKEEQDKYRIENKFRIDGPLLSAQEVKEQKLQLINKIFAIGYIFHRHKEPSRAWAIWSMDAKLSEGDESHGGSGKSLAAMLIYEHKLMKSEYREGRNKKLTDNPHIFEGITQHTDLVIVDDCHRYMQFEFFFSAVTGPTQVNPKNAKQYSVPFKHSPKFWFSSNFPPHNIDPSKERRILYTIFGDYYHYNKMGEYREERRVFDDFGKNLGSDFTEDEWNLYMNFIMQCVRFYLSTSKKITPPMDNVNKRNLKAIMGDAFEPWADVYFSEESGRLNDFVVKAYALNDFLKTTKQTWTTQKFTSALKAWCHYNDFELDPKQYHNAHGRIIRKHNEMQPNGESKPMTMEMIFIKTPEKPKELAPAAEQKQDDVFDKF